jgi:hypothetical protein
MSAGWSLAKEPARDPRMDELSQLIADGKGDVEPWVERRREYLESKGVDPKPPSRASRHDEYVSYGQFAAAINGLKATMEAALKPMAFQLARLQKDLAVAETLVSTLEGRMPEANELVQLWNARRCFICREYGFCDHREVEMDIAFLQAAKRRAA